LSPLLFKFEQVAQFIILVQRRNQTIT